MIDCKFIDLAGNELGRRLIPDDVGIVAYDQKHFAKMLNGDADNDRFPFVFIQTERLVVGMLEKIDGGKGKSRRLSGDGRKTGAGNQSDRRVGVLRKRVDKPEKDR